MRMLIAVGSASGWTRSVAEWVADEARAAGHAVELADTADAPSPEGYDAVFVGSGIRAGKWEKSASEYVSSHSTALARLPLVTFTSSLQAADPSEKSQAAVRASTTAVLEPVGLTAAHHGSHAGGYDPARVTLPERLILSAMRRGAAVDLRDEASVRAWTREALTAIA